MNFSPKSSPKRTAHEWIDYLRKSDGLGGILAKTEDLALLKKKLNAALSELDLGHLSSKIEAGWRSDSSGELFLQVSSASISTRLQQNLPSIIKELNKYGVPCKLIKVRIKPPSSDWEINPRLDAQVRRPRGLNEVAKKSWESLLDKLEPDSGLRSSIEKLLKNKPK